MKKFILTCVVAAGTAFGAFAQGTINFANNGSTLIITNNYANSGNAAVGFLTFGLYGAVSGSSSNSLVLLGPTIFGGPVAGRFNGGVRTNHFIAGGGIGTFQVRAWSGGYATYEQAISSGDPNLLIGVSRIWEQATGNPNPPATAPASFVFGASGFEGFSAYGPLSPSVPEPSTYALIGLAAGSVWMIRRRRN